MIQPACPIPRDSVSGETRPGDDSSGVHQFNSDSGATLSSMGGTASVSFTTREDLRWS
jgi:hypothetical protein